MKRIIVTFFVALFFLTETLLAQGAEVDFMRSIGKIYVVVAVIVAVFLCLVVFLFFLDRKLTRLENQIKDK